MANMEKNIDLFKVFDEDEPYDAWRDKYWKEKLKNSDEVQKISEDINTASKDPIGKDKNPFIDDEIDYFKGSVDTVLKKRDYTQDSKEFFDAQLKITKDVLPPQTMAEQGKIDPSNKTTHFDQEQHRPEDFLTPKELKHQDKMKPTPQDAFIEIYPNGKQTPQSAAMKPVSDIHKQEIDFASVTYKDQEKLSRIKQRANNKFGEKNSYVKNLWVLKTYRDEGGNLDYKGEKPKSEEIKKQTSADDHKGGYPYEGGKVDSLQLEEKDYNPKWIGDYFLPKQTQDNKVSYTPPAGKQLSSAWDGQKFDDGGFQDSFQSQKVGKTELASPKNPLNNIGELLQKVLKEKSSENNL